MNRNIVAGWAARGSVIILSFINTRLLIDAVGADGLAAYTIIISLAPWLALLNLGLPITIQNAISQSRGRESDYILVRNHSYGTMIVQALLLLPVCLMFAFFTHKFLLEKYQFVSFEAVVATHFFIYIVGICQLLVQIMYAEHESFWPNIYPAFAPFGTTIALAIASQHELRQFNTIATIIAVSNLIMPIHAAYRKQIFSKARFNLKISLNQIASSKHQMLFSALAASTLAVDYLVMSRILSSVEVVEYNLASRFFMTLIVVHGVILATSWTPIADLMHSGRKAEAEKRLHLLQRQGLLIVSSAGLLFIAFIDPVVHLLTGGVITSIPIGLCISFLIYILLRVWTDTFAMAIQGYGMVSEINKFLPIQALISVVSQYLLGLKFGATGIVVGLILSFALTAAWIVPRKFYLMVRNK